MATPTTQDDNMKQLHRKFVKYFNGLAYTYAFLRDIVSGERETKNFTNYMFVNVDPDGFILAPIDPTDERLKNIVGKRAALSQKIMSQSISHVRFMLLDPNGTSETDLRNRRAEAIKQLDAIKDTFDIWTSGGCMGELHIEEYTLDAYSNDDAKEFQEYVQANSKSGRSVNDYITLFAKYEQMYQTYIGWFDTKKKEVKTDSATSKIDAPDVEEFE